MPSYWYAMHRVYPKSCIMDHDSDNYSPRQHTRYSIRWLMWKRVRPGCGTLPLPTPRLPIIFPSLKFSIKVARRVRRRSAAGLLPLPTSSQVDIAPELLRWADFSTPFPSVALGGYSRFYETHTTSEPEPLHFCPLLSQQPEPSPSSEIPPKSPLFDTLPLIREVSLESLTLNLKRRELTITTCTTAPRSLKRRHRQLLRTPSIERDFALGSCRSPSDTSITINNVIDDATPTLADTPPSPRSNCSSSESQLSHDRSDSNYSEFPITPAMSVEDDIVSTEFLDKPPSTPPMPHIEFESESESQSESVMTEGLLAESVVTRPLSSISYCTARSDFSEI